MKVVLDTNALMSPFQYNINLDLELQNLLGNPEVYVPSCVLGELKRLSRQRWEARAALKLTQKYKVVEVQALGDSGVIEAAENLGAYVVTNDQGLIERLKAKKIGVIHLKQNRLVMQDD
jgi:hypothetical protein